MVTKKADHVPTKPVSPGKGVRKFQNINVRWLFLAAFRNALKESDDSGRN